MLAPEKAPVEKLTDPRSCLGGAAMPLKPTSSDPVDTTPPLVMITVPNWLIRSIPFPHATAGNSRAQTNITAARHIIPSTELRRSFRAAYGSRPPDHNVG